MLLVMICDIWFSACGHQAVQQDWIKTNPESWTLQGTGKFYLNRHTIFFYFQRQFLNLQNVYYCLPWRISRQPINTLFSFSIFKYILGDWKPFSTLSIRKHRAQLAIERLQLPSTTTDKLPPPIRRRFQGSKRNSSKHRWVRLISWAMLRTPK